MLYLFRIGAMLAPIPAVLVPNDTISRDCTRSFYLKRRIYNRFYQLHNGKLYRKSKTIATLRFERSSSETNVEYRHFETGTSHVKCTRTRIVQVSAELVQFLLVLLRGRGLGMFCFLINKYVINEMFFLVSRI